MPPLKAKEWTREERRKHVAANLVSGMNYRDIQSALKARGCDVSLGTISNDVKILLGRLQREQVSDVEHWVTVECRRLDTALNAIWDKVQNGDYRAIDRLLQIQNQRAKYLGLFKPVHVTLTDDQLLKEYEDLLAALAETVDAGEGDQEAGSAASGDGA
jgi:hypothetical protein